MVPTGSVTSCYPAPTGAQTFGGSERTAEQHESAGPWIRISATRFPTLTIATHPLKRAVIHFTRSRRAVVRKKE